MDAFAGDLVQNRINLPVDEFVRVHVLLAVAQAAAIPQELLEPEFAAEAELPGVEPARNSSAKVGEVAVIGLPDEQRGEMVCAVVQLAQGAEALDFEEMVAFCREAGLMTQKIPERLELTDDMPRAGTGKIVKKELKERFA